MAVLGIHVSFWECKSLQFFEAIIFFRNSFLVSNRCFFCSRTPSFKTMMLKTFEAEFQFLSSKEPFILPYMIMGGRVTFPKAGRLPLKGSDPSPADNYSKSVK